MHASSKKTLSHLCLLALAVASPYPLSAAGPDKVDLRSAAPFVVLSGAGITTTGGGAIDGDVGASPIAGSAIGVACPQVTGTIYAVDASGPACAVIDASLLTAAKGDLTTAYNDAAGRTPIPSGPNLNPGLIPGSGNIGRMTLLPGLYKFTTTAMISGADVTLMGGPNDVWIFQCAQDLQLASGIKVILAGGARAENIFWQVGTSAVLGTSSSFKGTILADQSVTMETSSTIEGRALAFEAGVVFNGSGASRPAPLVTEPEIVVEQPLGIDVPDGGNRDFGSVVVGNNNDLVFTIKNTGTADLTGLGITIDGADASLFTVTANPTAPVAPNGDTTFTVSFAPLTTGLKTAALRNANNDATENPFDIALTGTATAVAEPEIVVEQPLGLDVPDGGSRDFGPVVAGDNGSLVFTIKNTGTADLTGLNITIDGQDASLFTVTVSPNAPVGPNGETTFAVRFAPLSAGVKTAVLHIASNDATENPFDITLTGTATAVAEPEIVVEQPLGTNIPDGGSRDYSSVVAGAEQSLIFTIRNTGNADLTGLGITIDGADASLFTVTTAPTAPVGPNGGTTFTVRFAPLTAGLKTAVLHIANNDATENPFDITLTGTATAAPEPEIVVEQPLGSDIVDGVGSRDFGSVEAGSGNSLIFTIRNTGSADLTGLGITIDGADASDFTVTTAPTAPVGPNGGTTFTVRFAPLTAGLKTAALHIANNDATENPFDIALTGTSTSVDVTLMSPIALNPQTGLFEQTVQLTNAGPVAISSALVLVQGLPADVYVYNAAGTTGGVPYLQYNHSLAAGASVDLVIEYARESRVLIPQPVFTAQATDVITVQPTDTLLEVDHVLMLSDGRFLIEFTTTPGRSYGVQYSSDLSTWTTVLPTITAPGDRVQWYDDGPPKTESMPVDASRRYYRIFELP